MYEGAERSVQACRQVRPKALPTNKCFNIKEQKASKNPPQGAWAVFITFLIFSLLLAVLPQHNCCHLSL